MPIGYGAGVVWCVLVWRMEGPHRRQLPPAPGPPTGSSRRRIRLIGTPCRVLAAGSAGGVRSQQRRLRPGGTRRGDLGRSSAYSDTAIRPPTRSPQRARSVGATAECVLPLRRDTPGVWSFVESATRETPHERRTPANLSSTLPWPANAARRYRQTAETSGVPSTRCG